MVVTNGQITYERTVRPADFESRKWKVEFSFAVDDGEDAAMAAARVADIAEREVHKRLGLAVDAAQQPPKAPARPPARPPTPATAPVPEPEPATVQPAEPVVPITDVMIDAACRAATRRLNGPDETVKVCRSFYDEGMTSIRQVAQEKRPALMAALNALGAS